MRNKRVFNIDDLMQVMGHKFGQPNMAGRSLKRLTAQGLLESVDGKWRITQQGYDYLRTTTRTYYGEHQ